MHTAPLPDKVSKQRGPGATIGGRQKEGQKNEQTNLKWGKAKNNK